MIWHLSYKADPRALLLADAHYSRQQPGTNQFLPPAQDLVLMTACGRALWASTWPMFVGHDYHGAWICNIAFGEPTSLGMVTFVDADKVRHKRDPGRCFLKAGFRRVGLTKVRKRVVLQLLPKDMPPPEPVIGQQRRIA